MDVVEKTESYPLSSGEGLCGSEDGGGCMYEWSVGVEVALHCMKGDVGVCFVGCCTWSTCELGSDPVQ